MLRLEHFSFAFNGRPVLDDLDFALEPGVCLSVIGPNGAGKSTLLRCLMRLHGGAGRHGGRIFLKGAPLERYDQRALARTVGYVAQAGGPIPPYTVDELLRLSRYPRRNGVWNRADADAVDRAARLAGIGELARRPLRSLSGGERQRAYLAAALAQETELLLLDEPAAFLDPRHRAEMNRLLRVLNGEHGLTLVVVTHDLNDPLSLGGRVLALAGGRRVFFGQAGDLPGGDVLEETFGHRFVWLDNPLTGRPVALAGD